MSKREKGWIFTINNWTRHDLSQVEALKDENRVVYLCWEEEIGPQNGVPHLQGFVFFKTARTMGGVSKFLSRATLHVAYGNASSNQTYCSKEQNQTFQEFGDVKMADELHKVKQGSRTDIRKVPELMKSGRGIEELIAEGELTYQAARVWEMLERRVKPKLLPKPELTLCLGPKGSGKTEWCMDQLEESKEEWCTCVQVPKWWDPYTNEPGVLIDDLRCTDAGLFGMLLAAFNKRIKMMVPVKGKFSWWQAKRVYITSLSLDHCAPVGEPTGQLVRRCDKIYEFEEKTHVRKDITEDMKKLYDC